MDHAFQTQLQQYLRGWRASREITFATMDIGEGLIWKARKQPDGSFMIGYKQMAGWAGCCRDTAIDAVARLIELGMVIKAHTYVWSAKLKVTVQGKNIYRLVLPTPSLSKIPTPSTSQNISFLSSLGAPEDARIAHERETAATGGELLVTDRAAPGDAGGDEPGPRGHDSVAEGRSETVGVGGGVSGECGSPPAEQPLPHRPDQEAVGQGVGVVRPGGEPAVAAGGSSGGGRSIRRLTFAEQLAAARAWRENIREKAPIRGLALLFEPPARATMRCRAEETDDA